MATDRDTEHLLRVGSPEHPIYRKMKQAEPANMNWFMIAVDEGWRSSILCVDMYEWAADWLIEQLQGKPLPTERN